MVASTSHLLSIHTSHPYFPRCTCKLIIRTLQCCCWPLSYELSGFLWTSQTSQNWWRVVDKLLFSFLVHRHNISTLTTPVLDDFVKCNSAVNIYLSSVLHRRWTVVFINILSRRVMTCLQVASTPSTLADHNEIRLCWYGLISAGMG